MRGEVGVLRVESFIVLLITKAQLEQAKAQLAQAKVILIDVRGNGEGFGSSVSYLVEDIVGSDKVLWRDKTREGLQQQEPYIFRSYFDDAINAEAKAEIELGEQHPYIEWRTRLEAQIDPRPHFILIDNQCGSSCDLFAAIIKDYGSAKILGIRTMGALLGGDAFRLRWQGFALIVPAVQVVSSKGYIIEGVGAQPDIEIPECANHDSQCFERAIDVAGDIELSGEAIALRQLSKNYGTNTISWAPRTTSSLNPVRSNPGWTPETTFQNSTAPVRGLCSR